MKFNQGDIFEVYKNDGNKFFFRYLTDDEECLMGNVIQVFDYETEKENSVDLDELSQNPIKFNAHVYIKRGVAENLFKKVGNRPLPRNFKMPHFKQYEEDIDFMPEYKSGWFVWQVNGKQEYLGKIELPEKYKDVSFAGVKPPDSIIKWYETGESPFKRVIR